MARGRREREKSGLEGERRERRGLEGERGRLVSTDEVTPLLERMCIYSRAMEMNESTSGFSGPCL